MHERSDLMLLAMDIGNTHIHLGLFHGKKLGATWTVSNSKGRTADELGILLRTLLADAGQDRRALDSIAVANVVPTVHSLVADAAVRYLGPAPLFVSHENCGELLRAFRDPSEVGADRIANTVAGYEKYGGPLIVVDFGTATTFDAISEEGAYLGGVIAPGIAISIDALFRKAARLPRIDLKRPDRAVATDTVTSMQAGIIFGYAGLVDSIVNRVRQEIGDQAPAVATGGMASLVVRETGAVPVVDEHLTLEGIRIVHDRVDGGKA